MRFTMRAGALALALAGTSLAQDKPAPADAGAPPADVPVKVVVLFSSGVGYFEHGGAVKGTTTAELRFKTAQINDVLKSLVLQDEGGGKIGTVVYPSQEPIERTLKSFQVDITGNPTLPQLLNQLRGAKVRVTGTLGNFTGTILGVERKEEAAPKGEAVVERWVLNLFAEGGIQSLQIDQLQGIQLLDPELQQELEKALTALAQARDQDKKPVTIHFEGAGERRVRIGYVVETPIWKTSYRLILPSAAQKDAKPKLQGWAIVENQTDNDWNDVRLSLVSGRPISFVQNLYTPLYIPRPVVEPELYASLRPQTYDAGMTRRKDEDLDRFAMREKAGAPAGRSRRAMRDGSVNESADEEGAAMAEPGGPQAGAASPYRQQAQKAMDPTAGVSSVAQAGKVGELFQYAVDGVSLPRQRSAMIPIVTDDIEVERVSIYNRNVMPRNPLNGARVKNTTGKHLLQGPITVLDGASYAGDARIDDVPPGQERLLSYAIDLKMLVDSTSGKQDSSLVTGKIVQGILRIMRKHVYTQDYVIENKDDKEKGIVVEHPFRQGWKLVDSPQPIETTETLYRFKGSVAAGKSSKLAIKEEHTAEETIAILHADVGQIEWYSRAGEIPAPVREALAKAMKMKIDMVATQRQINDRQKELSEITAEQSRIRANMNTVQSNTQYYQRLLNKLNEQESKIEAKQTEIDELRKKLDEQRKALEEYLQGLNVG